VLRSQTQGTMSKRLIKDEETEKKPKSMKEIAVESMKAQHGKSLADFALEEDDDVYDVVDEKEYAQVVEQRRKKGDFVVDDGK